MLRLWDAGHAAYAVGGGIRDLILVRPPGGAWDLATDAPPEAVQALFERATYENRFGTVAIAEPGRELEITTFRTDHDYVDHRRPARVEFGRTILEDLARRDFTINALAWGADRRPDAGSAVRLLDPHGGLEDLAARRIRAVGEADDRFAEDALRMLRAVRFAAVLGFVIEPATRAAIERHAGLAAHLSAERTFAELARLLTADRPSIGLRPLADTGLLAAFAPELDRQRGVPQAKIPGDDLWDHVVRTVDAAPAEQPIVRLAALLHDVGKPETMGDGHFHGHDAAGARIAALFLDRLRAPLDTSRRVEHLVRHHMFTYEAAWSAAAVRRFLQRIGPDALDDLLALRAADNAGSGLDGDAGLLPELARRCREQLETGAALTLAGLAVDGRDLIGELGIDEGPIVGRLLEALLDRVVGDPALNERGRLLGIARRIAPDLGEPVRR